MGGSRKVAVYTSTRNLYNEMAPAIKSLLLHSDVDEVWALIEDDALPYDVPVMVHVRNVSGQTYFCHDGPNMRSVFTYMAMMRAVLAMEFPDLDRILSLDVDTFAVDDVSALWNLPLDGYYFAAAYEPRRSEMEGYFYTNTGVCLYNLEKLRDGVADRVVEKLNSVMRVNLEQDVFNQLCVGSVLEMPPEYNATQYTKPCNKPKIVHYAGVRGWTDTPEYRMYDSLSWDEVLERRLKEYGK